MGHETSTFSTRRNVLIVHVNEILREIVDLQNTSVKHGHKMGGKIFANKKKSCKIIEAAKSAYKFATRDKSTDANKSDGKGKKKGQA
jgi:hypothetical protein